MITFIDTPGAYPGLEAEAHGQGEAIARCLAVMSRLKVPIISVVIGEGGQRRRSGSGHGQHGADAGKRSVLRFVPRGLCRHFVKDSARAKEACDVMKLTAQDLVELKVIDRILPEPEGGAHTDPQAMVKAVDEALVAALRSRRRTRLPTATGNSGPWAGNL